MLCTALQKHGPDWKAKYERRFCNRDVPDFGHHFSYKRYVFSIVSSSEMITIQIEFFALTHAWSFFLREKRSQTLKKGWFKHSWKWKSKLQIKALCRGMFIYRKKILRITAGELRQLAAATYIDLRQNSGRSARG